MPTRPAIFKWRQTEPAIILCAIRWYLRYSLSLRDVEELLEERVCAYILQQSAVHFELSSRSPLLASAVFGLFCDQHGLLPAKCYPFILSFGTAFPPPTCSQALVLLPCFQAGGSVQTIDIVCRRPDGEHTVSPHALARMILPHIRSGSWLPTCQYVMQR